VESKRGRIRRVKRGWETVRDNLKKAGWNCGCISSADHEGRQFWVVAVERSDAGRFIVHADQELPAFLELESAIKTDRHNHECDCPERDEELVALRTFALKKRF
jgi:hypothetical protein